MTTRRPRLVEPLPAVAACTYCQLLVPTRLTTDHWQHCTGLRTNPETPCPTCARCERDRQARP